MTSFDADVKDLRILYQLDLDARKSYAEIGKSVRLSKQVVAYRIARMVEAGVIRGFHVVIDVSKLGFISCVIWVGLKHDSPEMERGMLEHFKKDSRTWWIGGREISKRMIAAAFLVSNHYELYEMLMEFLKKYRHNVREISTQIYYRFYAFRKDYLAGSGMRTTKPLILYSQEKAEVDETDLRLLSTIGGDARISLVELAKKTGITPLTAMARIRGLEKKGVIRGYRPFIDLGKIGYKTYKMELELEDFSKREEIMRFAARNPNTTYIFEKIGGSDVDIELELRSEKELRSFADELRSRFSEAITGAELSAYEKEHKFVYLPPFSPAP